MNYGIPSEIQIKRWVNNYRRFRDEGLTRSRQQVKYVLTTPPESQEAELNSPFPRLKVIKNTCYLKRMML